MANDLASDRYDKLPTPNHLRPYTSGIKDHEHVVSTIVLYYDKDTDLPEEDLDDKKISELTAKVNEISSATIIDSSVKTTYEEEYGTIANLKLDGNDNSYYSIFNNFSLLTVTESNEEIVKINLNFSSFWNAFFFGKKPKVYGFNGYFIDTADYPHYQEFMIGYEKYISGRRLIEKGLRAKFVYKGRIVDGYMLNLTTSHNSSDDSLVMFKFTVLVTNDTWIRYNFKHTEKGNVSLGLNGMTNAERLNDPYQPFHLDPSQITQEQYDKASFQRARSSGLITESQSELGII